MSHKTAQDMRQADVHGGNDVASTTATGSGGIIMKMFLRFCPFRLRITISLLYQGPSVQRGLCLLIKLLEVPCRLLLESA
jgi:hypothetical protein